MNKTKSDFTLWTYKRQELEFVPINFAMRGLSFHANK